VSALFTKRYPAERSSVPAARHAVLEALTAGGFSDPDVHFKVGLALTEATANVVCHAYPDGTAAYFDVAVDRTAGGIAIAVSDQGVGMDTRIGVAGLGVGLALMRAHTTSLGIDSGTTGTIVTMRFRAYPDLS